MRRAPTNPADFHSPANSTRVPLPLPAPPTCSVKTPAATTSFQASGLRLSDFARHVPSDLDIDARKATFSTTGTTTWKNGRLAENTRYIFTGLQTATPNAETALPLAFLTGPEGNVVLDVRSERDFPGENIPALDNAVATFQRQVVKAKVSPILLAGKEFADLVGSEFAEFRPGGYELTEQGQKVLARFAALLNVHPSVGLRITGAADKIIDGDTLNRQLEDIEAQRVAEENKRRKAAWQVERDAELARRKAQSTPHRALSRKSLDASISPNSFL